ncbi:MAG: helix-turn-helix transcriptional regulator, partial [Clostridia bacterium]|nr:helix-turn-helix transcriptional regulator [Clostridia bacterium]
SMATEALSVSSRSLQSAVRHLTGMSFREYVIDRRIAKAKHLLLETQLTVSEISEQCGYASVNAFYKSFKKACMVSPNEMRGTTVTHNSNE